MVFDVGYQSQSKVSLRPGYRGTSLPELFATFPTEESCIQHVFDKRFGGEHLCPRCGGRGGWRKQPRKPRVFVHRCGQTLSPLSRTVFDKTKLPLRLWFYAFLHFANTSEGVTSSFLERHLGINRLAVFRLTTRIRLQLAALDCGVRLGGTERRVYVSLERIRNVEALSAGKARKAHLLVMTDDMTP